MRFALLIGVAVSGLMLSSCASPGGNFIGDNLPEWAGGLPPDAPPRKGAPGYRTYIRTLSGEDGAGTPAASATTGPATAPSTAPSTTASPPAVPPAAQNPPASPSRKAPGSIDQPIH